MKTNKLTIGQKLSPVLVEIEDTLWEHDLNVGTPPEYSIIGFRAAMKIFMSVIMDKMWELQANENLTMEDRTKMVEKCGADVRALVKTYTNIDTHDLYQK